MKRIQGLSAALITLAATATCAPPPPVTHPPATRAKIVSRNLIDEYIWKDFRASRVIPARKTNDYEFIRRATLDLTGRIPRAERVQAFVHATNPQRRSALIDELLKSSAWTDKWTMYFGDHFRNTERNGDIQIQYEGRNAFYKYLHVSLTENKPYNKMAAELIAARGNNTFDQANGQTNYLVLGTVVTAPEQDAYDNQAAKIAREFLGLAHVDCLLCHDGRRHLDTLNLWASKATRRQAWGLAAFLATTQVRRILTPQDPKDPHASHDFFTLNHVKKDYNLDTNDGNRPSRQPFGSTRAITPAYMFGGQSPAPGEDYRTALARFVTGDFQFARASVNYIWAQFFGRGIVDPPDQFDLARLDPDHPPPAPWTLQPSNARLLDALARNFIESGYDLKALMRLIVSSETYQLASEYPGRWDPAWDKYFARHTPRRLWGEEIHDSVLTALDLTVTYTVPRFTTASPVYGVNSPGFGTIHSAMQSPDVVGTPMHGSTAYFLDLFLRGNRDDQPRRSDTSVLQALGMLNDGFIEKRIHAEGSGSNASYLAKALLLPNEQLIDKLFLDVLSRPPKAAERATALSWLGEGDRRTHAEDLLWTLFNKVDFVLNY